MRWAAHESAWHGLVFAMSSKVPWTYPGGPPCCCVTDCPTITTGVSTATRLAITADTFALLYAGGTMRLSFAGNVSATAVSIFGNPPAWSCEAAGSWSAEYDFLCSPSLCVSQSTRSLVTATGDASAPSYRHLLESNIATNTYTVIFDFSTAGTAGKNCASGQQSAGVSANLTYINGVPGTPVTTGTTRIASSVDFVVGAETLSAPSYQESYGTVLFFSTYLPVTGNANASGVWTPSAP